MQTMARSMADTGPMGGRYMPHAPPIVGRYGKRPHSRMRRLQLRTMHDLISSPRAFAGRAAPKERLVDSADVPAPRLTARGAQALLLVSRAVGVDRQPAALGFVAGHGLRRTTIDALLRLRNPPRRPRARPEKVGCILGGRRSISAVPDWR